MSGKAEQAKAKDAQADQVIGGAKKENNSKAKAGDLFGAVTALAAHFAPDLELAPKSENETETDLAIRLLGEVESNAVRTIAAYKGNATKAENARADDHAALKASLVQFKLATEAEVEAADFNPVDAVLKALGDTLAECNSAKRSLRAQKGATTRVKGEIEALEEAAKPRALGPVDDQLSASDLYTVLSDERRVEIAFTDGRAELSGVPPVEVRGDRFTFRRGRLSLDVPSLQVKGPVDDKAARVLAGYAFLIDGEQVAYAPRIGGQLTLGGGQQYELKDDVILT